jgi:hypothetical protein
LLQKNGIKGPFFISVGDVAKLDLFLEKNPNIPRDKMFIDTPYFDANKSAGLGKMFKDKEKTLRGSKNFKAPGLSFSGWRNYLSSASKFVNYDDKEFTLEVVTQLGATFAVDGEEVVFAYDEGIPGDDPAPSVVIDYWLKNPV